MNLLPRGLSAALALVALVSLAACGGDSDPRDETQDDQASRPLVMASFHPVAYFAERIGGDLIAVECPLPAGADPAGWQPDDDALARMRGADLIVTNGAEFEHWVATSSLPESRVLQTANGFKDEWLTYAKATTHSHGPEGEHSHAGTDGHTWMDPVLAKKQAMAIRDALQTLLPDHASVLAKNFDALAADLDALDADFRAASPEKGPWWLASHPAYNYPAKRYGWRVMNLDLDPSAMPDEKAIHEIKHGAVDHGARYLVWESAPSPEVAAKLEKDFGLKNLVVSPAELLDGDGDADFLSVMRENLEALKPVLAK